MYKSSIKSTMIIDEKKGNVKLEEFDVKVDSYKNRKKLKKAKDAYNLGKEMEEEYREDDWPRGIWDHMYEDYLRRLKKWKKRNHKKK